MAITCPTFDCSNDDSGGRFWHYHFFCNHKISRSCNACGFRAELWRYGCPIAYGLQLVPDKYMQLYMLNPVAPILTSFRYAVFGFGYFNFGYYAISWCVSIIVFFIGLIMFSRIERTFMDTI